MLTSLHPNMLLKTIIQTQSISFFFFGNYKVDLVIKIKRKDERDY